MPPIDGHPSHHEMQPSDSEEFEELSEEEPLHQQDQEEIPEGEDADLDGDDGGKIAHTIPSLFLLEPSLFLYYIRKLI